MMKYEKLFASDGEPVECACCQYPGRVALFEKTPCGRETYDLFLCEVCSQTMLSIALKYPLQCPDPNLYRSIAVIGNMLLGAIRGESP